MHVPADIRRLHRKADRGESAETPLILIGELVAFLAPILIVMLAIGFGLYFSFGGH